MSRNQKPPAYTGLTRAKGAGVYRDPSSVRASACKRGYGRNWQRIRGRFIKQYPLCNHCEVPTPAQEVDHIISLRNGGTNKDENLQSLCKSCHSIKTAREDGSFGRRNNIARGNKA